VFWIWSDQPGRDRTPFNVPDFADYGDQNQTLDSLAGFFAFSGNLSDDGSAERVQGIRATANLFELLGAHAIAGRVLRPSDEQPGEDHVVVLTDTLWKRRFGGDAGIVGQSIRLNSESYTVVGVLAPHFVTPVRDVEFAIPFVANRDPRRNARNSLNFIIGVGRLRAGVSKAQAEGDMTAVAHRLQQRYPVENARKMGVRMVPLLDGIVGSFRTALLAIFAAVGAVLLIACANLANLMLTRAAARRKEIAVRLALGSSRARLIQQCLTETLVLGLAGGGLGLLLAQWGVAALMLLVPADLPRATEVQLDAPVLLFSIAVSMVTGILFGVVPAFAAARVDLRDALHGSSRGSTAGGQRVRGVLVACEVALAFVLLIVAGMFGKSFANVQAVAPGFDAAGTVSARLSLPEQRFDTRDAIVGFQRALQQRLASLPMVTNSAAISLLPLSGLRSSVPFTVEGRPIERERIPSAQFRLVSAGYFEAMRIPLVRGRTFLERDTDTTQPVAVINEALASQWLKGIDPIGARLLVDDNDGPPRPVEIVGLVGNVKQIALDADPTWDLYLTYPQIHADTVGGAAANMFWVVRTTGDPMSLVASLTREIRRVDPEVAASQVRPLASYLSGAVAPRRFNLLLLSMFGGAALALAVTGIYAVISYGVSQRAREIGIRVALGARRADIVRLVIGQGARFTAIGLLGGTPLAMGATRLLSTMLFGLSANDATTFLQVAATIAGAAVIACAVPAWRGMRIVSVPLTDE
jgi:putative ABC transport system permease protein